MSNKGQKFQVDIDGIDLPDEVVQRIDSAIRKAVLTELATVELARSFAVEPLGGPGHLQGLVIRAARA